MAQTNVTLSSRRTRSFALWKMYGVYAGYLLLAVWWAHRNEWDWLLAWLAIVPAGHWLYVALYPRFRATDEHAPAVPITGGSVTFYGAVGCPLSRTVQRRLAALQRRMGFSLKTVDVTLHPGALSQFGSHAVPVVEVDGWNLLGDATSARLSAFIAEALRVQTRRELVAELAPANEADRTASRPALIAVRAKKSADA